jgi:hypothetical protein
MLKFPAWPFNFWRIFAQLSMQPVNYNSKARFNNENTHSGLSVVAFSFAAG